MSLVVLDPVFRLDFFVQRTQKSALRRDDVACLYRIEVKKGHRFISNSGYTRFFNRRNWRKDQLKSRTFKLNEYKEFLLTKRPFLGQTSVLLVRQLLPQTPVFHALSG